MFNQDRVELCEEWNKDLTLQSNLLKLQATADDKTIQDLTKTLNDERHKRQKARKSRLAWGAVGIVSGYIIYGLIN